MSAAISPKPLAAFRKQPVVDGWRVSQNSLTHSPLPLEELPSTGPLLAEAELPAELPIEAMAELRTAMTRHAGVVRDEAGLTALIALLDRLERAHPGTLAVQAARLIAEAALARRESRGGHWRSDYPETSKTARHTRVNPRHSLMAAE